MDVETRILEVYEATAAAHAAVYGDQVPMHYGALISWANGGPDPLSGVSVFWHPTGHWHYIGWGMAERDDKVTPNAAVSGWGFEFTLRLAAPPEIVALGDERLQGASILAAAGAAPRWPITVLNDLGRYVFKRRAPLGHGHYIRREGAPWGEFLGLVSDPELGAVDTVNGRYHHLQLVDLDQATYDTLAGDDWEDHIARVRAHNPLLVSQGPLELR